MKVKEITTNANRKTLNKEPFIFIHGLNGWGADEGIDEVLPYWGATTGNLTSYLQSQGYESYSASVGPLSSAWDRACELYAQIKGTTVDYGVAHSKENHHERYGRTYHKALIPNWGELDEEQKIQQVHLIGHSFGGTTIRLLIHLLTNGSPEEIEATPADEISGLFTGGKGNWVKSATTICTPHNSASVYYPLKALGLDFTVRALSYIYAGILGRSRANGRFVDFHLEQFGLTDIPNGKEADKFFKALSLALKNKKDSCQYDLRPEATAKLNDMLDIAQNVYYFSYAFSTTHESKRLGIHMPNIGTNPVIALTSLAMGCLKFTDPSTGVKYEGNWLANDALVNTESAKYPLDEPHKDFDSNNIEPGVWQVMPIQRGDHGTAIGLFSKPEQTKSFYLEHCKMLNSL